MRKALALYKSESFPFHLMKVGTFETCFYESEVGTFADNVEDAPTDRHIH